MIMVGTSPSLDRCGALASGRLAAFVVALAAGSACATSANRGDTWTSASSGRSGVSSGTEIERFFPLVDGRIYHYVELDDASGQGLLVARAVRTDALHGELRFPSGAKRFEYTTEGVSLISNGAFVLKGPLAVGTAWRGEHGGATRIVAVAASVDVVAGHFTGCVQTLEEVRGDRRVRYATTFCPNTGVVLLEAASGGNVERAELKSYGAPVQLGPDGLERIP